MKPNLTTKQLLATNRLLKNLKDFADKRYGTINNLLILKHNMLPNTIIVKYDKVYTMGGEMEYEFVIATIDNDGKIEFIDKKFKDVFERSAFLSECLPLDIEDETKYQKID